MFGCCQRTVRMGTDLVTCSFGRKADFYVVEGLPEAVADGFLSARHTEDQIRTSERRILDECGYRRLGMYLHSLVGATCRSDKNSKKDGWVCTLPLFVEHSIPLLHLIR